MSLSDDNYDSKKSNSQPLRKKRSRRELETLLNDNSKARRDLPKCPVCEYRIEPQYWQEHYQYELTRLAEPTSEVYTNPLTKNKGKRGAAVAAKRLIQSKSKKKSSYEERLERIQKNRQKRSDDLKRLDSSSISFDEAAAAPTNDSEVALQVLLAEDSSSGGSGTQTCFICNQRLFGDLEAVNLHIDNCLSNPQQPQPEEEQDTDMDDQEGSGTGWLTYEIAGQTRVRATDMMEGGYGGVGFATSIKDEENEDEEDLDVEDDDAAQFGESQYTERDIVVNMDDEDAFALREMVSGGASASRTPTSENGGAERQQGFEETVSITGWEQHTRKNTGTAASHSSLVIDSLKARIHQLEYASKSTPRCLICLEPYKTPLTSIVCWHVHCEQCWLQTLGSKKLCPQCQKITTPADLRRIYL